MFINHDVTWQDVAWTAVLGVQCTAVAPGVVLRSALGGWFCRVSGSTRPLGVEGASTPVDPLGNGR
jgi:hypothetical protein